MCYGKKKPYETKIWGKRRTGRYFAEGRLHIWLWRPNANIPPLIVFCFYLRQQLCCLSLTSFQWTTPLFFTKPLLKKIPSHSCQASGSC